MPKKRRKALYGNIREELKKISHELAPNRKNIILPKAARAKTMSTCAKSAIAIARTIEGRQRNYNGANFWARGCAVLTVGSDEEITKGCIREQEDSEGTF